MVKHALFLAALFAVAVKSAGQSSRSSISPYLSVGSMHEEMFVRNNYQVGQQYDLVITPKPADGYYVGLGAIYKPAFWHMPLLSCEVDYWHYTFTTRTVSYSFTSGHFSPYVAESESITNMVRIAPAVTFGLFKRKKVNYFSSTGMSFTTNLFGSLIGDYLAVHSEVGAGWDGYFLKLGYNYGLTNVGGGTWPEFDMRSRNIYIGVLIVPPHFMNKLDAAKKLLHIRK